MKWCASKVVAFFYRSASINKQLDNLRIIALCCIEKTRAINKWKQVNKREVVSIEDYDIEDNFSITAETESSDINAELKGIVEKIEEPDKEILIRYYYYYQKTSRIAEIMKLNIETVKSKLKRTRQKIKTILTERGYGI